MPCAAADQPGGKRPAPFRLRNLMPLGGWFVTSGFLAAVAVLTWMLKTRGTEWGYPIWLQYAALLAFWVGGYIGVGHFLRRPCTWLQVQPGGGVLLTRAWPWWVRRDHIPARAIAGVAVQQSEDSEGDPCFRTTLLLVTGEAIILQQGHREARQHAIAGQLRRALGFEEAP